METSTSTPTKTFFHYYPTNFLARVEIFEIVIDCQKDIDNYLKIVGIFYKKNIRFIIKHF